MSFILNYLDEALDKVTGRYEGDDDKEDLGSSDDGVDAPSNPLAREARAETADSTEEVLIPNVSVRNSFSAPSGATGGVGIRGGTKNAAESHNRTGPRIGSQSVSRTVPQMLSKQQHTKHQIGQRHQHQQQRLQAVRPVPLDDQNPLRSGRPASQKSISSIDDRDSNTPSGGVPSPVVDSLRGNNPPPQRAKAQASTGEGLGDTLTRTSPGSSTLRKGMMESMVAETLERRRLGESHEDVAPIEKANADVITERQGIVREEKKESQKKVEEDVRTRVLALEGKAAEELRRRRRELMEERRRELEKKKEDEERKKREEEQRERERSRQFEEGQRETDQRRLADDTNAAVTATIKVSEQIEDTNNAKEVENGRSRLAVDRSRRQGRNMGHGVAVAPVTSSITLEEGGELKGEGDEECHRRAARDRRKKSTSDDVIVTVRPYEGPIKQEQVEDGPIRKDDSPSLVPQSLMVDADRAREEAWAEAVVVSERKARTRALLVAQARQAGGSDGPDEKAPPASVVESDPETETSRRGSITLDQSDSVQPTEMPTRGERDWTRLFSDRRQQDKRTAPFSASCSVTSSQVSASTLGDPNHPPTAAASHADMGVPAPIISRSTSPHDYERIRGTKKRRGSSNGVPNGSNRPMPEHECAACLGMWNGEGSALNRWYRCRRCGATVHSACRQFFDVAEACVESGEQGIQGVNPSGWRSAVNCPGVVQVGVLQAFGLSIKPGDSVYVALRLLPWKERVKTGSAKWGDLGASWPSHPSARHDLLHLYNSEASPVPTLRVEVWRSALRVLDDLVGYATINMAPLLARPTSTSERWHGLSSPEESTELQDKLKAASAGTILLSLGFLPTGGTPNLLPLSAHAPPSMSTRKARQPPLLSASPGGVGGGHMGRGNQGFPKSNVPVVPETLNLDDTAVAEAAESLARPEMKISTTPSRLDSPGGPDFREMGVERGDEDLRSNGEGTLSEVGEEGDAEDGHRGGLSEGIGGVHLFRIKSYSSPVWCQVCGGLLLGVLNQGFRCEACGMDVHQGCQLRANFARSCPGRSIKNNGRGAGSSENAVPAANLADPPAAAVTLASAVAPSAMADSSERRSYLDVEQGVGIIKVHLRSAHRCWSRCQCGKHSYTYNSVFKDPDNSRASNHVDGARHRHRLNSSSGDVDKGFLGTGGVLSPGRRRRRRWSGARDDNENSEGFFKGDHYCRLRVGRKGSSASPAQEVRTEAVFQTSEPVFNRSWTFGAPSYDSIISIDLVDASNDRPVGRFETSVIVLLQEDYDARSLRRTPPSKELGERRLLSPGAAADEDNVTGLLQVRLEVEENKEAFFGPKGILGPDGESRPRRAPPRQNADLSVESLKALLGRLKSVLFWFKMAANGYKHLMSWDNPALTSISLVIFVYLALVGDTEYFLSLLPFSVFLFMTRGYFRRRSGRYVHDWLTFGAGTGNNTPSKPSTTDFRSVGTLKVAVVTGRGLVSSDLKLPGNGYVRVTYVPKSVKDILVYGKGKGGRDIAEEYLIGQTAPLYTGDSPEWGRVIGGVGGVSAGGGWGAGGTLEYTGGTDALLQNVVEVWSREPSVGGSPEDHSFEDDFEDMCFVYPMLQPLGGDMKVLSWDESTGFLRFSVVFANPFNRLMDKLQGQVVVPLTSLVQKEGGIQPEVRGWFDVSPVEEDLDTSTSPGERGPPTSTIPTLDDNASLNGYDPNSPETQALNFPTPMSEGGDDVTEKTTEAFVGDDVVGQNGGGDSVGSLFLRLQLTLPDKDAPVTLEDFEASRALQVLLGEDSEGDVAAGGGSSGASAGPGTAGVSSGGSGVGSANNNSGTSGSGSREGGVKEVGGGAPGAVARLIGMPMGVLSTVRDVQDAISEALDTLEAIKQLLNWTHPHKTAIVYGIVVLAWVVLMVVPGRYIILAVGLYEFSKVWLGVPEKSPETPPLAIKLRNMLISLPVDSELSACYAWESRAFAKQEEAAQRLREQRAKLKLLGAGRQWEGNLRLRDRPGDPWESRYVVVLGHRMAWWGSSKELEQGKKAKGQLLLQGHAGVTHLSPMEAREVADPRRVLCIFGRSPDGLPHKVLFMADTVEATAALEDAILSVVETKGD